MIRVAVVGVSHWHAEGYIRALCTCGAKVTAVSDDNIEVARRWGETLGCPAYPSAEALLAAGRPDLVFALARHCDMTALAAKLVEENQPFVMEKPMGLRWKELALVAARAAARKLWAGVDFVARTLGLVRHLLELRDSGELGIVATYTYRLLAGEPQRYRDMGVPWMLDPAQAGGGPLYNFGPHVFDLFLRLTGEPIQKLHCWMSHRLHRLPIEDYAHISVRTPSGVVGDMTVGYVCPGSAYDHYFALSTDRLWVSSPNLGSGTVYWRDGRTSEVPAGPESEDFFLTYTRETLRRFQAGEPPAATISEMVPVLRAINEAQVLGDRNLCCHCCQRRG